jgi:hypothetical protein
MGWLLADIATTLIVALAYWTVAVLRDAARSLAGVGRRVRTREAPGRGGIGQTRRVLAMQTIQRQPFEAVEPECARHTAP